VPRSLTFWNISGSFGSWFFASSFNGSNIVCNVVFVFLLALLSFRFGFA
jgi:hypothetical protein